MIGKITDNMPMITTDDIFTLADEYKKATGLEKDQTVSSRVFGDSKKLTGLRDGAEITVSRFNGAIQWFHENWPDGADWPKSVQVPKQSEAAQ